MNKLVVSIFILLAILLGAGIHSLYTEKIADLNAASWGLFVGCLDGRLHRESDNIGITAKEWKSSHAECVEYVRRQRNEHE